MTDISSNDPAPLDPTAIDPAIDDMAAEVDQATPADASGEDSYADDEPAFTGVCRGGPYDGRAVAIRFPGGFILYDKQRRRMWTYAAVAGAPGVFAMVGDNDGIASNDDVICSAAEGAHFDVLAYDAGPAINPEVAV